MASTCREFGWTAATLVDVYGAAGAQEADDETWIDHAGRHGLVVLTRDERIARKAAERAAVLNSDTKGSALSLDDRPWPISSRS